MCLNSARTHLGEMQVHLGLARTHLCLLSPLPWGLRRREVTASASPPGLTSLHALSPPLSPLKFQGTHRTWTRVPKIISASYSSSESSARDLVSKRLANIAKNLRRFGTLGFWGQLVCSVVSSGILAFSVAISGNPTSQATFYATAGGIVAAFLSVFWSFGYIRLSDRLRATINDLSKAPPRADVVRNLQQGIVINLLGMGLTLLGMQATVGTLVAKSLTSTAAPYLQGTSANYSPVLALDVFLVQASVNTVLSHFLGLVFSIELLRSVTLSQPPPESVIPKPT